MYPHSRQRLLPIPLAVVFLCALSLHAVTFKSIPTSEKAKVDGLSFLVTFDAFNTHADFSKGDKFSTTMKDTNFMLRGTVGFDKQQAYSPESTENLLYPAADNANWRQGTMIFWVQAGDYTPSTGNKENVNYAQIVLKQADKFVDYRIYEYAGTLYFDAYAVRKLSLSTVGRSEVPLRGIKKGEWFQVAAVWDDAVTLFVNGRPGTRKMLPAIVLDNRKIHQPDPNASFIGIRNTFDWYGVAPPAKDKTLTRIDDFAIYSRTFSPLEIANQYKRMIEGDGNLEIQDYELKLYGVDRRHGMDHDQIEAEFDFAALPDDMRKQYDDGKLTVEYTWSGPNGKSTGQWTFQKGETKKYLKNITEPGLYTLQTRTGKSMTKASIERPDLSFIGNQIGLEDSVPAPWTFHVQDKNIHMDARVYKMDAGPLPSSITIKGRQLLKQAPLLIINEKPVVWKQGDISKRNSDVTYKGTAQISGGSIQYSTTVEFDGFIDFRYSVHGKPKIQSMELVWQVNPEFTEFLMVPEVYQGNEKNLAYNYWSSSDKNSVRELWLASEKGGFCYTNEFDANWFYQPGKPVYFVNRGTGECRVKMIQCNSPLEIPEGAAYHAFFTATPTRPFAEPFRAYRHCDSIKGYRLLDAGAISRNGCFTGVSTFEPHPTQFAKFFRNKKDWGVYGLAGAMTTASPVARYFRKFWDIPGAANFIFNYTRFDEEGKNSQKEKHEFVLGCSKVVNDLYAKNYRKLFSYPEHEAVKYLYFDCAGCAYCTSALHGCAFQDSFGRNIAGTLAVRRLRDLFKRTIRELHANRKGLWIHAQRDFFPMVHGFADAWFPGEQFEPGLSYNINYYTDNVPEIIYRSELNSRVMGVRTVMWTAICSLNRKSLPPEQIKAATEAMCSISLLFDVDPSAVFTARKVLSDIWDIMEKYGITTEDTQFHRFDRQNEITSSHPDLRVSWWQSPDGRILAVVANTGKNPAKGELDFSKLEAKKLHEEYRNTPLILQNGKIELSLQPRSFSLIGIQK